MKKITEQLQRQIIFRITDEEFDIFIFSTPFSRKFLIICLTILTSPPWGKRRDGFDVEMIITRPDD